MHTCAFTKTHLHSLNPSLAHVHTPTVERGAVINGASIALLRLLTWKKINTCNQIHAQLSKDRCASYFPVSQDNIHGKEMNNKRTLAVVE